jgi:hypothetical protein
MVTKTFIDADGNTYYEEGDSFIQGQYYELI